MVKNSIKVFARIRKVNKPTDTNLYDIRNKEKYNYLTIYNARKSRNKFRFHRIFDQDEGQEDVFDCTTKPVVNSVLHGFNGTIFAYGQTGSGKTYSITGCSNDYANRGIIPRSIQEIFQFTSKSPDKYTIFISYMEIYNEIGYDLLNPKHQATRLEDLPRVSLLDDGKGECHLRNLSMLPVLTEQEAMRLLFLGDTNRTIAETPMNDYSSRSHCIFTLYLSTLGKKGKLRRSKLNLVDLAGSERIYKKKMTATGTTLSEAKNINLSLHYLEQVILALSQTKRTHIPFRNSMMTYMLRDSLSGNSITVMIATITACKTNVEETITTCKFAQRVAMVNTDAMINEEIDPQEEIQFLRSEVSILRNKLISASTDYEFEDKMLTKDDENASRTFVEKFLRTGDLTFLKSLHFGQVKLCFEILRQRLENNERPTSGSGNEFIEKYKEIIKQKDEEITILTEILEKIDSQSKIPQESTQLNKPKLDSSLDIDNQVFEVFLDSADNEKQLELIKSQIEEKYKAAEEVASFIQSCQQNILKLRGKLQTGIGDKVYHLKLENNLKSQQEVYRESIQKLQKLKEETEFLEHGFSQEKIRLERKFQNWYYKNECSNNSRRGVNSGVFSCINESLSELGDVVVKAGKVHKKNVKGKGLLLQENTNTNTKLSDNFKFSDTDKRELSYNCGDANSNKKSISFESSDLWNNNRSSSNKKLFVGHNLDNLNNSTTSVKSFNSNRANNISKPQKTLHSPKNQQYYQENSSIFNNTAKSDLSAVSFITPSSQSPLNDRNCINNPTHQEMPYNSTASCSNSGINQNYNNYSTLNSRKTTFEEPVVSLINSKIMKQSSLKLKDDSYKTKEMTNNSRPSSSTSINQTWNINSHDYNIPVKDTQTKTSYCNNFSSSELPDSELIEPNKLDSDAVAAVDYDHFSCTSTNNDLYKTSDGTDFLEFMKTIPLTGDRDVDEEIVNFYRTKFTKI